MAVVEKRATKDGAISYRAKVRVKGFPAQSKTFRRLTDAKRWAQKTEIEIHEGLYLPKARKYTLAELLARYRRDYLPRKCEELQKSQGHQLDWWEEQIGSYLLADVSHTLIIEQRHKLEQGTVQGGKQRSPSTCNRYAAALSHVLTIAWKDLGWIEENPIRKVCKLNEPEGRVRCLADDERERLLVECQKSKTAYLYLIVLIAMSTGMRLGEIRLLSWRRIDLKEGAVVIYKTKNKQPKKVPLQNEALKKLKEHAKIRRIDSELVFPSAKNPQQPASFRTAWLNAVKRAELEDFCFHDLRHTAASYLAMSGATARDLCDIFGWKTIQMAMRYAHLFDSHKTELVARMNEKFIQG